ncbi:MAG: type II toxin-antitoxin system RelE/ParE family toxin [Deltaproteobacteria bacterium]|nr:type II toxin-antitoxin system RelE/ParE family toxin [Deltaproteobacteria bacterium]
MVKWSAAARRDLKEIHAYIARDSRYYAKKVVEAIVDKSCEIEPFSERGRAVLELEEQSIRELLVYSYRLIYEIADEDIIVLAVIHGRRKLPEMG